MRDRQRSGAAVALLGLLFTVAFLYLAPVEDAYQFGYVSHGLKLDRASLPPLSGEKFYIPETTIADPPVATVEPLPTKAKPVAAVSEEAARTGAAALASSSGTANPSSNTTSPTTKSSRPSSPHRAPAVVPSFNGIFAGFAAQGVGAQPGNGRSNARTDHRVESVHGHVSVESTKSNNAGASTTKAESAEVAPKRVEVSPLDVEYCARCIADEGRFNATVASSMRNSFGVEDL